jgi:hypothetical protein
MTAALRASPVRLHHLNWRGEPLVSHQVIAQLIGSTSTETGLKVCCEIDNDLYPKECRRNWYWPSDTRSVRNQ